jgi:hypothetical protein
MAEKRYEVVGPHSVAGHPPGEEFAWTLTTEQESYYVGAGHLQVATGQKKEKPPELRCEACEAHGTATEKKATFKDLEALQEHYRKEHPALVAPTE